MLLSPAVAQTLATHGTSPLAAFTATRRDATADVPSSNNVVPLPPPVVVPALDPAARSIAQVMAEAAYTLVAKAQDTQDNVLKLLRG